MEIRVKFTLIHVVHEFVGIPFFKRILLEIGDELMSNRWVTDKLGQNDLI